jgi:hypothetical protein
MTDNRKILLAIAAIFAVMYAIAWTLGSGGDGCAYGVWRWGGCD